MYFWHYKLYLIFLACLQFGSILTVFIAAFKKCKILAHLIGLKTPDGIAFDWLSGMLYWTDAQENTINRLSKDKTKEVLIHEALDEPRAIALSPCDGM